MFIFVVYPTPKIKLSRVLNLHVRQTSKLAAPVVLPVPTGWPLTTANYLPPSNPTHLALFSQTDKLPPSLLVFGRPRGLLPVFALYSKGADLPSAHQTPCLCLRLRNGMGNGTYQLGIRE